MKHRTIPNLATVLSGVLPDGSNSYPRADETITNTFHLISEIPSQTTTNLTLNV